MNTVEVDLCGRTGAAVDVTFEVEAKIRKITPTSPRRSTWATLARRLSYASKSNHEAALKSITAVEAQ
jgi:hypothetical protein